MDRSKSHITLAQAADELGVHYMTAYRYVRTGRLPAHKVGREWQVDRADVERIVSGDGASTPTPSGRGRRRDRTTVMIDRLTHSDEQGAWAIVEDAVRGGMEPNEVYLHLLVPALADIGERWQRGETTVAQEHQASALVLRLVGRLGPRFSRPGRKRGTIVLGAPPGDVHGLPTALLSDLLRAHQYSVIDLGADVPASSWRSACAEVDQLVAVGLCASTPDHDDEIRAAIASVRLVSTAPIVLGGRAIQGAAHSAELGASSYSDTFESAVDLLTERPAPGLAPPRPAS